MDMAHGTDQASAFKLGWRGRRIWRLREQEGPSGPLLPVSAVHIHPEVLRLGYWQQKIYSRGMVQIQMFILHKNFTKWAAGCTKTFGEGGEGGEGSG